METLSSQTNLFTFLGIGLELLLHLTEVQGFGGIVGLQGPALINRFGFDDRLHNSLGVV